MPKNDAEVWEHLIRWLEEKHPGFESNLSLRDIPGVERGLIASHDLKKGDTLLHIPSTCMLNPLTLIHSNSSIPPHLFPQTKSSSTSVSGSSNTPINKKPRTGSTTIPRKLDTTQLLTLHLALTKDLQERYKSDWEVYIDSLPRTFRPWHPLTWIIPLSHNNKDEDKEKGKRRKGEDEWNWYNDLYEIGLSESTKLKVQDVKNRFDNDHEVLSDVLKEEDPFKSQNLAEVISKEDILWAWLNVNTRSISIPLGLPAPSERNNHTLVPIMDFINHSSNETIITPRVKQLPTPSPSNRIRKTSISSNNTTNHALPSPPLTSNSTNGLGMRKAEQHLLPNKIDFKLICPDRGLKVDEEVFFEYGGHSSSVLFAEYGFCEIPKKTLLKNDDEKVNSKEEADDDHVNGNGEKNESDKKDKDHITEVKKPRSGWLDMKYGEVDLTSYVNELWDAQDEDDKEEKKKVLEDIGCWGGNTLHSQPSPSHPAHSLLMTLRLIHLPSSSPKLNNISKGLITYISPLNESSTLLTLSSICNKVVIQANKRGRKLGKLLKDFEVNKDKDRHGDGKEGDGKAFEDIGVLKMLLEMGEEEKVICVEVLNRLERGEEFS